MDTIIIANWKMSLNHEQTMGAVAVLAKKLPTLPPHKQAVICPSFVSIVETRTRLQGTGFDVGAQDLFWEERGAYTGEVSPLDITHLGCRYAIIGHSERRKYLAETDETAHRKTEAALKNNIIPIICIGETWEERAAGRKEYVVLRQLNEILNGIQVGRQNKVIVAYEPVWAISSGGGGTTAEPKDVQYVNEVIQQTLLDMFGKDLVNSVFQLIYGGSISSQTVAQYTHLPSVSGVLVGSASLQPDELIRIIQRA